MIQRVERSIGRQSLTIEYGKVARQAAGAVTVQYGQTVVLVAVARATPREGIDFFPLTVDYREKTSSAGKIPGGFFKREGRPTTKEILTMRMTDRPIRPLFPPGYREDLMISAVVLSADDQYDPDVLSIIGASAALSVSPIPFLGPLGAVRVAYLDGGFRVFPNDEELKRAEIDLVIAGTKEAITMVECASKEVSEDLMAQALEYGFEQLSEVVALQEELTSRLEIEKLDVEPFVIEETELYRKLHSRWFDTIRERVQAPSKPERKKRLEEIRNEAEAEIFPEGTDDVDPDRIKEFKKCLHAIEAAAIRDLILAESKRVDGRALDDVRGIECEVRLLPRTHGSSLFTRGETQALVTATLGTAIDEQIVDGLKEEYKKSFMLHYNFPSFCVGEVRPNRGPSRRDIGHGNLAERALMPVLPSQEDFPYTIRVVSDILESNGSSSMATVCGGTLALMDAGVRISRPVAGIAMGLVKEGDQVRILTDILGDEDHTGDMDFKVAGTRDGITALQMDIKCSGLTREIMSKALERARVARMHVLDQMDKVIDRPRDAIAEHAPKIALLRIPPEKIGVLIGPGGRNVRKLQEETETNIEIEDDGRVVISSTSLDGVTRARDYIERLTDEAEVGRVYKGKVVDIKSFGAFVEILPGTEGLIHVSELDNKYVGSVTDVVQVGDEIEVKVILVDDQGKIKLSRKALLEGGGDSSEAKREKRDGEHDQRDRRGGGGGRRGRRRGGSGRPKGSGAPT